MSHTTSSGAARVASARVRPKAKAPVHSLACEEMPFTLGAREAEGGGAEAEEQAELGACSQPGV